MDKTKWKMYYTVFVFMSLAAFEHIVVGLFPPLLQFIADDLNVNISNLGFLLAINILVTSISSMIWGYLSGKSKRKQLIIIGTFIWVVSMFLTSISKSYTQLLTFQILTGVGLGCITSIGFSVLTDSIPYRKRGLVLSFWGMTQGLGGIAGAVMASLTVASTSWRWPFEIVGIIGLFLIFLFLFIEEPQRGQSDPELKNLANQNKSYNYIISPKQIKSLLLKRSNKLLFIQALFMNVTTGSLIWLPTLFIYKTTQQGYSLEIAVITSGYLYAFFQLGGMASAYFGHLGDRFQMKTFKGRAYITALFVIVTMPLYILLFILPMNNLSLTSDTHSILILLSLLREIVTNPWISLLFFISLLASAAQSANTPNWLALITDVNLPEHRGTAFSVANLFNSLGRTVGNAGVGILLAVFSTKFNQLGSYIVTLSILQLFLIPSALCYIKMAKYNVKDIKDVKSKLRERAG